MPAIGATCIPTTCHCSNRCLASKECILDVSQVGPLGGLVFGALPLWLGCNTSEIRSRSI